MKRILALGVLAVCGAVSAETTATDPLLRATVYVDIARAGDRVVAVGDRGQIIYSDDEGSSWQPANSPTGVMLTAVCFADARHGWAVGHDAVVLGTRDGGQNWSLQYSDVLGASANEDDSAGLEDDYDDDLYADDLYGDNLYDDDLYGDAEDGPVDTSGAPLLDVYCASSQQATAVGGYGYMVETRDGGESWQRAGQGFANHEGWHFYSLTALADKPETLLITGEKGTLYRSQDNGASWDALESPYHGTFFGALSVAGSGAGQDKTSLLLAYGLQGNIWLSRNDGESWERIASGVRSGINAGVVLDDGAILLVGNAGALLTSRDHGKTFARQYVPGRQTISSVLARKGGGVIIVGAGGVRVLDNLL